MRDSQRSRFLPRILADRYRLVRPIGGTGLGRVYEAEIVRTGTLVAVKILSPLLANDAKGRAILETECLRVAQIDHDALVPYLDVSEDVDRTPFVVMELVRGLSLREKLEAEGAIAIRDALWIGWHTADALAAVHRAGGVHAGLKPENIFLQRQRHVPPRVRLLDVTMARPREHLSGTTMSVSQDGTELGTPRYMSPEQARGDRSLDAPSDIYALAVVLYEALTGQSPYPGGDGARVVEMLSMVQSSEPIPLRYLRPDATPALEALLAKAMTKDRNARVPSMEELMSRLGAIAAEPLPGAPVTDLEWGDDRKSRSVRTKRGRKTTPPPRG